MVEFGGNLEITYVMGGLAREFDDVPAIVMRWLGDAAASGMPVDPRIWAGDPPRSSYPACIAVRAAAEQGAGAAERYLRVLREGLMCHSRRLDGPDALVKEARRAELDLERFRIDLESNAILEGFASDLDESRAVADAAGAHLPVLRFLPDDGGEERRVGGKDPYEEWRAAATAAGASLDSTRPPDVPAALRRFGSMATAELAAVCDLPGPRAGAEAWRLASEWRVRRVPVLFGELWEAA
jgi:putative protein-disulfide isomerase